MEIRFIILFLFFGSAILDLIYVYKEIPKSRFFSKTLLMPLLIVFYILNVDKPNLLLLFALIFSFFGDLFLLFDKKRLTFFLGLICFLITHFLYFILFTITSKYFKGVPFYIYLFLIPYIIYGFSFYNHLKPQIDRFNKIILFYIFIIILMSFSSLPRFYFMSFYKFLFPFIGSILFIISDSLLSLKKFKKTIKENSISVMLTYILAQFLIVLGFI